MEDSHSVHLYLPSSAASQPPSDSSSSSSETIPTQPPGSTVTNASIGQDGPAFFGVFDGHGGSSAAKFAGTTLHQRLADLPAYKSGDYEEALRRAFFKTDEDLRAEPTFFNDPSGCTAVTVLATGDGRLICANSGDSRCVLGVKGEAKALSNDHKPTNKEETARIQSAGGFVEFGRVNGNLALSRAMGDFEFKQNFSLEAAKQIVTVDPEITTHKNTGEEEFVVLACDGIWDCLSSQQVIDFVRRAVANGDELGKICEDMMVKCTARDSETGGIGCDNMTVVIVALLNGRSVSEWRDWVKERVEKKVGYDTPESIPDVFAQVAQQSSLSGISGFGGGGFRVTGAGGLANIASILGASGLSFRRVDENDEDAEGGNGKGGILVYDDDEDKEAAHEDDNQSSEGSSTKVEGGSEAGSSKDLPGAYMDDKALKSGTKPKDITEKLDASSDKVLTSDSKKGSVQLVDEDGDSTMDSDDESDSTTTGAQTPNHDASANHASGPKAKSATTSSSHSESGPTDRTPSFRSIGSPEIPTPQELQAVESLQKQVRSEPGRDEAPSVAKVEGLMDTSEGPLKL
ncbi:phosphatase 2C-domain-containing protein [Kockovaella imperatae]|uniref:protein-serine/threonine phosphatase n=1 Tax=Kockovaella imperatae TaxID=4999 RepID=A0A1Y1U9B6_9TREE|nr:phosphatase 2C-domain-containing protein [Kockovaella imperatae]ORX34096.1 phosphatase 2C-domain-containing protein [Kockovaella imperatae]